MPGPPAPGGNHETPPGAISITVRKAENEVERNCSNEPRFLWTSSLSAPDTQAAENVTVPLFAKANLKGFSVTCKCKRPNGYIS